MTSKVIAIGLDGAEIDYIRDQSPALPALRHCLETGQLHTPAPPTALSGSVWPTFYTGAGPGEHGIYQHLVWDPRRMGIRRITSGWCGRQAFWETLDGLEKRCIVVDVPYSFPTPLRHGAVVTDWATHGQTWPVSATTPATERLLREIGPSPMGREMPVRKSPAQLDRIRRRLLDSARLKGELLASLIRGFEWDLLTAVFAETHRGGHTLWTEADNRAGNGTTPLLEVYQAVDRALGRVLAAADETSVAIVIFSVHGMMRDYNQSHLVRPVLARLNELFVRERCGLPAARPGPGGLVHALRGIVPPRLQHAVGSAVSDRLRQWVVEREMIGGLDWSRTPGFALRTDIRTELRLNLAGRESRGMLEPGSSLQEEYVDWIREVFLGLADADSGARLVKDVVRPPELFPGPRAGYLPDLVATWRPEPPARRIRAPRIGALQAQPTPVRGGDHTDRGFALLLGGGGRHASLPPLERTDQFAAFLLHLATRDSSAVPAAFAST